MLGTVFGRLKTWRVVLPCWVKVKTHCARSGWQCLLRQWTHRSSPPERRAKWRSVAPPHSRGARDGFVVVRMDRTGFREGLKRTCGKLDGWRRVSGRSGARCERLAVAISAHKLGKAEAIPGRRLSRHRTADTYPRMTAG